MRRASAPPSPAYLRYTHAVAACHLLRGAVRSLTAGGCPKAAAYARRALKSAEGAERNALRFWNAERWQAGQRPILPPTRAGLAEARRQAKEIIG